MDTISQINFDQEVKNITHEQENFAEKEICSGSYNRDLNITNITNITRPMQT